MYLLIYNVLALLGWAAIFGITSYSFTTAPPKGAFVQSTYNLVSPLLLIVQTSAVLEIFHSLLGLVRSPVSSVVIQVFSRLNVLWGFTYWSQACHTHWSVVMMILSWSFVELFRYGFYIYTLLPNAKGSDSVPDWLFHARYNLFIILYPTGISGEIMQIVASLPELHKWNPVYERIAHVMLALYVPLGPYMIYNMFSMRRRAYKNRKESSKIAEKPLNGLVWPVTNKETQERSTTITNKAIWEDSVKSVDAKEAEKIRSTGNWRFGYVKHVSENVRICLASKSNAIQVANSGLISARERFKFIREGRELSVVHAMDTIKGSYFTGFIKGNKSLESTFKYSIPYKNKLLNGDEAKKQLDVWVNNDTIEPSAAEAIKNCIENPQWTDLRNKYFVLLGATSAMGPLNNLLSLGANIIAVDINRKAVWKKLIDAAKDSPGTLTFPLSKPQKDIASEEELSTYAGANLLENTPEIANWLSELYLDKELTIGNYTYLDGALHVQLSLACDLIIEKITKTILEKGKAGRNLAFLCTPTDVHPIPKEAYEAAVRNYKNVPRWQRIIENLLRGFGNRTQLRKNAAQPVHTEAGKDLYVVDGIVTAQGPNYALAKRLQHWRCVVGQTQFNQTVSSNIAPSTSTKSVVSNAQFAAAYYGFRLFKGMEVMEQETSSAVMLGLLLNDLNNPKSVAKAAVSKTLENPFQLFEFNSFHGGVWRSAYKIDSIGVVAALYYYLNHYQIVVIMLVAMIWGTTNYVLHGSAV